MDAVDEIALTIDAVLEGKKFPCFNIAPVILNIDERFRAKG